VIPAPTRATTKMPNNIGNSPFWFGYSLNLWNSVSSKLLAFAVFTGILAAVASGLSSWIASEVSSRIQGASGTRIDAAEFELEKSRERTAALDVAVADANARVAEANMRTEELAAANLEIREKIAARRVTKEQHDVLVQLLSANPSTFDIEVMSDGESGVYASDLVRTLTDARWTVAGKAFPLGTIWIGLNVFLTSDPAAERLVLAFRSAGIPVATGNEGRQRATIMVGAKPAAF